MRRSASYPTDAAPAVNAPQRDVQTLKALLPYLSGFSVRITLALSCLILAKVANLGVPLLLKMIVDRLSASHTLVAAGQQAHSPMIILAGGIGILVLAYAVVRLSTSLFTELRELLFARVTEQVVRDIALQVFRHLHGLSLRFHLDRQTGGMTRDIDRGTRGIQQVLQYSLYSILPTLIEITLVIVIFITRYEVYYALVTILALLAYVAFTVKVSAWRTALRRSVNEFESQASTRAIDSLLNYETVKYFGNEAFEADRYDTYLRRYRAAAVKSQKTLSMLNFGQQVIISVGLVLILWHATTQVMAGRQTLGDLVLINTFMLQLYVPLNFLGVIYRELKQALADMDRMFTLTGEQREVADAPNAPALALHGPLGATVVFDHVRFAYQADRTILHDVDFTVPAGTTTAIVGHSGSGKSTLARLLFRFYDAEVGSRITVDGQDIRSVRQQSLRAAIGIVPQDTVLFNDTIYYNIAYGRPDASREEVFAAARDAQIHAFIESLPKGYDTPVGERGLKLSGGEKQRVAIARTLLKNPPILILDEATSALDSRAERAIQQALDRVARGRTTLVIAHRLSTVVNAQQILVMDAGRVVERGTHASLLAANGPYAEMWRLQSHDELE
ncbi:ABC transporter ATP-binding protein/permease [Robbsia sp. KACC 23696]|uniref:ABCB family ABC transporter ATP-binding protein/permease n=1 Tax=Robbsia sp. KACC 23696 TaxID=3149231 RepID=UPI00325B84F4